MKNDSIPMKQREHLIQDAQYSKTVSESCDFPSGTLTDMVLASANTYSNRPAIRGPRQADKTYREVSYAQLIQHASTIAAAITAQFPGEKFADNFVGILLPRDIEYIESACGVLLTGAAYLPLYESLPKQRMQWYLKDSGAGLIITSRKLQHLLTPDVFDGQMLFIEDLQRGFLTARQAASTKIPSSFGYQSRINASNLAYMIYTSGTTGMPKGVEVEHRGVCNMLHHHASVLVDESDLQKSVLVAALIFDSSIRETWLPLVTGGCLCIAENVFGINEGSMCAGTPSGLTVATFPGTLKTVMVGGERLTDGCTDNIDVGHAKKILNAYGPTETTVECLMHYTDTTKKSEISWIGLPIWNTHLYGVPKDAVSDANGVFPLAKRGEPCELFVGGVGVARGYRNSPDKTAAKFLPNTFGEGGRVYRTGDLVRWTESGDLEYLGRTDSQVKLRGFRIELEEVERVCSEAKGVGQAAVVVKKDKRDQEHLIVYITPAEGDATSQAQQMKEAVLEHAAAEMSEYMVPSEVVVLSELPFTIGGKVDKRSLPEPDWSGSSQPGKQGGDDDESEVVPPSNASEVTILQAICEMLDVETNTVSVTDNIFTDYGLTSIDAALLRRKLNEKGIEIDGTATILRHGTVRGLANHILGASNGMEKSIMQAICEMLDVSMDTISVTDNIFTDYGLTSIDAALLRRKLNEKGIEIDGTATILRHGTVRGLATHLIGSDEQHADQKAAKLDVKDVAGTAAVDTPLPRFAVWVLTALGFVLATMLTYAMPIILWVIELSVVHQWGSCSWKSAECGADYNPWLGFLYNVLFTPLVLMGLFVLELFMVWCVKWTVIGRYRSGVYSLWGPTYLRWWFVNTFMSFTYFFLLNPLRCTGLLNTWYRCLGAKIGKNVVLDTACIYEADLIHIADNVTVQSDAAIFGHVLTRQLAVSSPDGHIKRG